MMESFEFEKYFHIYSSRTSKTRKSKAESEMTGAFERSAVSIDALPPFDATEFQVNYDHWFSLMMRFNLLFYGFGSKIELLRDFAKTKLYGKGYVIEVDGFAGQPRLMQSAISTLCEIEGTTHKTVEHLNRSLGSCRRSAYIIVHCIDDECMIDNESARILTEISEAPNIYLVASLDRIPLWSLNFYTAMKFYTIQVNTLRLYSQEIGFTMNAKSSVVLDSIERYDVVLKTLTETSRVMFSVLAKHQLKGKGGLTASAWQDKTQSELFVRMRDSFNTQVNEFLDHKLIQIKKDSDVYTIPLSNQQIQALLGRLFPEKPKEA